MPFKRNVKRNKRSNRNMRILAKGASTSNKPSIRNSRFTDINNYKVNPEPFPRVMYTKMKYGIETTLTTNALGTAIDHTFRCNSIYDPYFDVGGTTTTGHTQMANIYGAYVVTGAKINLRFFDPDNEGLRVGIRLRIKAGGDTNLKNAQDLIQQPMTYMEGLANSGKQIKSFNLFVRPWTLMGLSKLEYMANSSLYASQINANPSWDNCLFDVFALNPAGNVTTVRYMLQIEYYVQLYDRKYLTAA